MARLLQRVVGWIGIVAIATALVAVVLSLFPEIKPWVAGEIATVFHHTSGATIDAAEAAMDRGDGASAARIAAAVVAADPSNADVDNRAGNVALRAGDRAGAERDYRAGQTADDRDPWNYVALGELFSREGRYPEADTQLRAALTLLPDAQFLHYDLGMAELGEHLDRAALADFEAELKRSPGYAPADAGRRRALAALAEFGGGGAAAALALAALPSPSPSVSPSPSPVASPGPVARSSPNSAASVSPRPFASPTTTATPVVAIVRHTEPIHRAAFPRVRHHVRNARASARRVPSPTPMPSPTTTPQPMLDLVGDARAYMLTIARDPGFTHALPTADPSASSDAIQAAIKGGSADDILTAGAAALASGRVQLAQAAFTAATDKAASDWRGPYFLGLEQQQNGDPSGARTSFSQAASRGGPAAVYVSLAFADVAVGDDASALDSARRATSLSPDFMPARFAAGMTAVLAADVPAAERDLAAAVGLGGAPARTEYFLDSLRRREGTQ